jgi:hypothetical protein
VTVVPVVLAPWRGVRPLLLAPLSAVGEVWVVAGAVGVVAPSVAAATGVEGAAPVEGVAAAGVLAGGASAGLLLGSSVGRSWATALSDVDGAAASGAFDACVALSASSADVAASLSDWVAGGRASVAADPASSVTVREDFANAGTSVAVRDTAAVRAPVSADPASSTVATVFKAAWVTAAETLTATLMPPTP